MKIVVYAICKNEEQFVDRWMDSMSEADQVVVLDTGSTDHTVELLRGRGAQVTVETVSPWRFDAARNRSLDLVPEDTDICVCTDLDEILHPGWKQPGLQAQDRRAIDIPGPFIPMVRREWCSGMKKSMPDGVTDGYTRSMKYWPGRGLEHLAPR
jgi:glycosyltransferase involved in cell wall biosynthesis